LKNALSEAISIAKLLSGNKKKKVEGLAEVNQMARGHLEARVKGNLKNIDIETKNKNYERCRTGRAKLFRKNKIGVLYLSRDFGS